ncbi:MAG: DUF6572 domain-containing protein [bacterium]
MTEDGREDPEGLDREEFVREFGEPGVQNPNVLDLILASEPGEEPLVTLVMTERRPFGAYEQLRQLEEKINRYLGYVLDGYLIQQFPEYEGWPVSIRLECVEEPTGETVEFLGEANAAIEGQGLRFEVVVEMPGEPH